MAIPRHLITTNNWIYRKRPVVPWAVYSVQGRLLKSALSSIWRDLPQATLADAEVIANGFVGLLNGLLSPEKHFEPGDQIALYLFEAMKDYLEARLLQKDLGVESLCKVFHCSRAKVYRLFQDAGGVNAYLRRRRMECCVQELMDASKSKRGAIRETAERWGFYDTAHLSKLFKLHYGVAPSDLLGRSNHSDLKTTDREQDIWSEVERLKTWTRKF